MGRGPAARKMWLCRSRRAAYKAGLTPATGAHAMNAPHEMDHIEVLRVRLQVLEREHRDLDDAIRALEEKGTGDVFTIRRLKKQKLQLKDRIRMIEDEINPDIIA
jgi:hypothetical protein